MFSSTWVIGFWSKECSFIDIHCNKIRKKCHYAHITRGSYACVCVTLVFNSLEQRSFYRKWCLFFHVCLCAFFCVMSPKFARCYIFFRLWIFWTVWKWHFIRIFGMFVIIYLFMGHCHRIIMWLLLVSHSSQVHVVAVYAMLSFLSELIEDFAFGIILIKPVT